MLFTDPGETTGWALYYVAQRRLFVDELEFNALGKKLEAWMSSAGPETVVGSERYVLTPISAQKDPHGHAIQGYGLTRWAAIKYNAYEWVGHQNSSDALSLVHDDWLRAIGWYRLGMRHANDASRHVVRWLIDAKMLPNDMRDRIFTE